MSAGRFPLGLIMTAALAVGIVLGTIGVISRFELDLVFLAYAVWALIRLLGRNLLPPVLAVLVSLLIVATLLSLRLANPDLHYMPYIAIVPANLVLAYVFARGLFGGREPVLLELIRLMDKHPADDPQFLRFVAGQCLLWSVMTLLTAVLALGCMVLISERAVLAPALSVLIAAQVLWFLLSHYYASLRYGRPETWLTTLKTMVRRETWQNLKV